MTVRQSELVQRASAALQNDPRTSDAAIDVVDENGVVTLTGTVASDDGRQVAEEITHRQEGVIQVINELEIETDDQEAKIVILAPPAHDLHGAVVGAGPESLNPDSSTERQQQES